MLIVCGLIVAIAAMLAVLLMLSVIPASPAVIGGMVLALIVAGALAFYDRR